MTPVDFTEFCEQIKTRNPSYAQLIWNQFVVQISDVNYVRNLLLTNSKLIFLDTGIRTAISNHECTKIIQKFKQHGWDLTEGDLMYSELTRTMILTVKVP